MSTTIRISRESKEKLQEFGQKGETFEDIIMKLYHQRNILAIHEVCKDWETDGLNMTLSDIHQIFDAIGYLIREAPHTPNLNGETLYDDNDYDDAQIIYQNQIIEMAKDEDIVGQDVAFGYRDLPASEFATNVYCLFEDIPAPTWHMSVRMKNPFY